MTWVSLAMLLVRIIDRITRRLGEEEQRRIGAALLSNVGLQTLLKDKADAEAAARRVADRVRRDPDRVRDPDAPFARPRGGRR